MYTNQRPRRNILLLINRFKPSNGEVKRSCDPQTCLARFKHDGKDDKSRNVDSMLIMNNSQYLDTMYESWKRDPKTVSESWDTYFRSLDGDQAIPKKSVSLIPSATIRLESSPTVMASGQSSAVQTPTASPAGDVYDDSSLNVLDVNATIRAYQARGHLIADTDPLGIQHPESKKLQGTANLPPEIVVRQHLKRMTEADMDKEFALGPVTVIGGNKRTLPLREILTTLNKVYCGHLGFEYTYIHDLYMLDWLREKIERPGAWELPAEHRQFIWSYTMKAVTLEGFLMRKYPTVKRFGLEGCDSFIPAMAQILETASEHGVETVVIGMAHRGRMNTLINICQKPLHQLLTQFQPVRMDYGTGDVKYHLGTHSERILDRTKKKMLISVMANPSHLEAINPVIVGRVRAEQVEKNDAKLGVKSQPVLVHGDAAFSGQGVVYETMHLTNLPEYTTGGVMHVVINNQIGFTTDPRYSRSSAHCTDVARVVNAPIFHVHADDPDLVVYCSKVAEEYRAEFHNDAVLDIVGYRRAGHNEMDEPMMTQPLMYKRIREHPNVLTIYSEKLLKEGVITEAFAKEEIEKFWNYCETEFEKAKTIDTMQMRDWHDVPWTDFFANQSPTNPIPATGVDEETIKTICKAISTPPTAVEAHAQVLRAMQRRSRLMEARQTDWAMGEACGFLTLLKEGHHVRLSGQDVERGTFSHRIHIIHDQNRDKTWINILHGVFPGQALYTVSNSSLSEFGVSGFEVGYSAYNYNTLTIWEGQFGDFANNCQTVLDTILASGQTKWGRQVGLALFLPHGMEGQGSEHSSARIERFLELSDDDVIHLPGKEPGAPANETVDQIMTRQLFEINWIICNITTPANFFHLLRRQIKMPFRKPLVVATPKSLLRHPMAVSSFDDMLTGTTFKPVLADPYVKPGTIQKVLMCSGKVYYDLVQERQTRKLEDKIVIIRVEQLCPFPHLHLAQEVAKYPNTKFMWLQEEHKNQGPYSYVKDRISLALGVPLEKIVYGGRAPSSSSATGSTIIHQQEYNDMMAMAMKLD